MSEVEGTIRVGISACLLGKKVRFDGQHKKDAFVTDLLAKYCTFVPLCPEVEVGMGVPRESVRLERREGVLRMVAPRSGKDYTEAMSSYAREKATHLETLGLSGFILKKDSPSCGMERVKVYGAGGMPAKEGTGLFAKALMERMPLLPVEEEGRLHDPRLRENFVERLFAFHRLNAFFSGRWTVGGLVRFHTAQKLVLLAHQPVAYQTLGRMVAGAKGADRQALSKNYGEVFMAAMARLATTRTHTNVLQHMAGYFKKVLDAGQRQELSDLIQDYRKGLVPLVVPVTLIRHFVRLYGVEYLVGQTYLEPHPKELMLRNHV